MLYSKDFLNELRNTVKEMLLKGDIVEICNIKEFLAYSNIEFGDFIKPIFKEDDSPLLESEDKVGGDYVGIDIESVPNTIVVSKPNEELVYLPIRNDVTITAQSVHGHYDEDGTYTETPLETRQQKGYNPEELGLVEESDSKKSKPKYMPYFYDATSPGQLEGVVIYKLKAFIIEDLVTGEMLYKHTHYVARLLKLEHGDVISFNIEDGKLVDIIREAEYDFNDGINIVTNCPVFLDEGGYYVPSDMEGRSLTEYGSPVSPYNIPYNVVDYFNIQEDDSVDLYIRPNSIPYVLYVKPGFYNSVPTPPKNSDINSAIKTTKELTKSKSKTYQKYDFDLKGKSVGFIGVPTSQKERVTSLCNEKGAESFEFIDSSSHTDTVSIPQRFADLDIVVVVKRFVGHGTVYALKNVVQGSDVSIINTSSHSVDSIERALYRGVMGYPSEEGSSPVNYPLLEN